MRVRIKELVKKNGISYTKLGRKIQVTRRTLERWNAGRIFPSLENIILLLEILNCTFEELIEFKESDVKSRIYKISE